LPARLPSVRPPIAGQLPAVRPPIKSPPIPRPPITKRPPIVRRPLVAPRPWPWYGSHPGQPAYRPGYWWQWATAGAVTGWIAYGWKQPIYYQYGPGGNVYYQNNMVYVDGQQYCSAADYYDQALAIACAVPQMNDQQAAAVEWLPLGVFAVTTDNVNTSSMYLQLAVSKDGMIAGTFYNETTGAEHPVEGMIDQQTQRAAWQAADGTNQDLVVETGVYNLTQDQVPVLLHFGPDQTEIALLVRLDQPAASGAPQ
jgi:hypothetical protein